nr:MAG TPA: hypothetical protein [Caudoviricetes sp.]
MILCKKSYKPHKTVGSSLRFACDCGCHVACYTL